MSAKANAQRRMKRLSAKYPAAVWDIIDGGVRSTLITPAARGLYDELRALTPAISVVMEPAADLPFPPGWFGPSRAAEKATARLAESQTIPAVAEPEVNQETPSTHREVDPKKKGIRPGTKAADLLAFLVATPGTFDEVNVAAVQAGKFPNASEARDWSRYVLRQAGEHQADERYLLPGRPEPITITRKSGGRQGATEER
jgi:hypothetical protein